MLHIAECRLTVKFAWCTSWKRVKEFDITCSHLAAACKTKYMHVKQETLFLKAHDAQYMLVLDKVISSVVRKSKIV
jgi:hypothetical protein